jgi:Cu(I)/Ag(I) efflux system membrane fusion protein
VRLAVPNAGLRLLPGMYGDVEIDAGAADALVVPAEALVDTGDTQYVFLAREGGRFEPRRVEVGGREGERIEIRSGVVEGDAVVTTANFLIDADSRLRAALEGHEAKQGAVGMKDMDGAKGMKDMHHAHGDHAHHGGR